MKQYWDLGKNSKKERLKAASSMTKTKVIPADKIRQFLQTVIKPYDTVVLEGNNQKQASFLSAALAKVDAELIHHLHMVLPCVSRPEHLDLFEDAIACTLDFSYAGNQSLRIAQMLQDNVLQIGSVHTYLELYARLFVDLIPHVCLVAADEGDSQGNLYTGNNTEDTPTLVEATAFKDGIVIAQINQLVEQVERVDIPGDWVDFVVVADKPYEVKPLFTKNPRDITEIQILMAMLCIKGIYAKHGVQCLNHGVGFNTAAIELLLPTYGESLGLKGKICTNWVLNPHPTIIPAIESGWVKHIYCFGGELGMSNYIKQRPDVFATGRDGSLRSNRALAQMAGLYGIDMFIGSTLQMDAWGNSSTVTEGRLSGFGGAPNMGHNTGGRRHSTPAWQSLQQEGDSLGRGRKLVVQAVETFGVGVTPVFVETLDAVEVGKKAGLPNTPVMIYGDDVSHVVTEQGIAYLYQARNLEERKAALAAIAGVTPLGRSITVDEIKTLRNQGLVATLEDLGIRATDAKRSLLAARNMQELVDWSGGLYEPPQEFKSW